MDSIHIAVYQNLKLLTEIYPSADLESKLQKCMFKKPNTKGMQSVFYYLISILNRGYCHENIPWPVSFTSENYKFRVAVINFIEKECTNFNSPKLLPSLLNKADGDKYVRFVFNFVSYVTKQALEKGYKTKTMNKPEVPVNCKEHINLLNDVISIMYCQSKEQIDEHNQMMKNTLKLKEISDREVKDSLNCCRLKKEELYDKIKDALSYTNITEENMVEAVIADYEDELREHQRDYYMIRDDVHRILKKKESLLELIHLRQATERDLIDVKYLSSVLSKELAEAIQIPLQVIRSTLFCNSEHESQICLKTFLQLGLVLVKLRMKRFLKSNMSEKHLSLCQTADDIFLNTSKRFDDLTLLNGKLDLLISNCFKSISSLSTQYSKVYDNSDFLKLLYRMKTIETFYPRDSVPFNEKPLFLEFPFEEGQFEDPLSRMKKMKSITASTNDVKFHT